MVGAAEWVSSEVMAWLALDKATRCSGGAAHRNGLGTCHSKGAAVVVEEDATTMTKLSRR